MKKRNASKKTLGLVLIAFAFSLLMLPACGGFKIPHLPQTIEAGTGVNALAYGVRAREVLTSLVDITKRVVVFEQSIPVTSSFDASFDAAAGRLLDAVEAGDRHIATLVTSGTVGWSAVTVVVNPVIDEINNLTGVLRGAQNKEKFWAVIGELANVGFQLLAAGGTR